MQRKQVSMFRGILFIFRGKRVSTRKKTDEYSDEMVTVNREIMIKIKLLKKMLNTLFRILNNNHRMILRKIFYNRYVAKMHTDSTGKCLPGRPEPVQISRAFDLNTNQKQESRLRL